MFEMVGNIEEQRLVGPAGHELHANRHSFLGEATGHGD